MIKDIVFMLMYSLFKKLEHNSSNTKYQINSQVRIPLCFNLWIEPWLDVWHTINLNDIRDGIESKNNLSVKVNVLGAILEIK